MQSLSIFSCLVFIAYISRSFAHEIIPEKPTKLTSKNFHTILSLNDPWVVAFLEDYDDKKEAQLVALATSVLGLVQIGFVDMDDPDSEELVEAKRISTPQIRIYEYGEENKEKPKRAQTFDEAIEIALESYPDILERIAETKIAEFYSRSMKKQKPRKLPLIYFTDKRNVIPALRYLAIQFKDVYSFAVLTKPSEELMSNFTITMLPQIIVLSRLNLLTGYFEMIKYQKEVFGPSNFVNLLKFLIGVQNEIGDKKHRETMKNLLAGEAQETTSRRNQPGVEQLTHSSLGRICAPDSSALCVIAFLGSDETSTEIKRKEEILDKIRKSEKLRDRHIRYSWINATCHPNIAEAFKIDLTQLPYIIAVRRSENLFTNHVGSFSYENLRQFLFKILSGKMKLESYDRFPRFLTKDCRITKIECSDGVCNDIKKRNKKRGPKLGGGKKTEL